MQGRVIILRSILIDDIVSYCVLYVNLEPRTDILRPRIAFVCYMSTVVTSSAYSLFPAKKKWMN